MRRKDREMNEEFAFQVIDASQYGVLSMVDGDGEPYGVPLSMVRKGNTLYFHGAKEGRKAPILAQSPRVSIVFVGSVEVPELYSNEELDEIIKDEQRGAMLASKVFTTEFASAMVVGQVQPLNDEEEKLKVMRMICEKYTPTKMAYFPLAIKSGLKKTNVYSLEIEEIKGKRKKFGPDKEELKWGAKPGVL